MRLSIRTYLLINLLLALTLTTFLSVLGTYYLDQRDIYRDLDTLQSQTGFILQALTNPQTKTANLAAMQGRLNNLPQQINDFAQQSGTFMANPKYRERYQFQIWDKNDKLLLHSPNAPKESMLKSKTGFSDQYLNGEYWRVFNTQDPQAGLKWAIAERYSIRDRLTNHIMLDDIYVMVLFFPLSGCLIWFIVGGGLRSIKRVTTEVGRRAADHLNPVDLEAVPIEIQPLIDELNKLFLRLKQAFEREQRFAADAAHELRTPLAALKTQAQVALKTIDAHNRQLQLQNVIAGVDRCTHVVQQLLTLCRMNPDTVALEDTTEVDLAKIAAEVIGQLVPLAIDKHIEIELIANELHCVISGNTAALHALIRNLVDNAIRYTPENGNIKVLVEREADQVILKIIDTGPGIPADLRSRVFERFFRVLGTNVQGSGLGLAIVLQIVKLHRGNVRLGVPASGVGLEVEVMFPRPSINLKSTQQLS